MSAPRIVQVLDRERSDAVLTASGLYGNGALVGLDSDGGFWRFGVAEDGVRRHWRRLPLPPLPEGDGNG